MPDGSSRSSKRWIAAALVAVVVVSLGVIAVTRDAGRPPERPMTIDAALASFGSASAYYLNIPGIPGDSTVQAHANQIDVQTFSWGVTNPTGTASFGNLSITKFVDPASPLLMKAVAAGTTFPTVTLYATRNGSTPFQYYQLTLTNAKVRSFAESGNRSSGITDTVAFSYTRITLRFTKQSPTGASNGFVEQCWDLTLRASC